MVKEIISILQTIKEILENSQCDEELTKVSNYITQMDLMKGQLNRYDRKTISSIYNYIMTQDHITIKYKCLVVIDKFKDFHENKTSLRLVTLFLSGITNVPYGDFVRLNYDESFYYELNAILNDDTFQEMVYNIFSSKIINHFYQLKEQLNNYKNLLLLLSDKAKRNSFFKNTFYLINLPKDIKSLTNRYLMIGINYTGITVAENKLSTFPLQEKYQSLMNSIPKSKRALQYDENAESILLLILRPYLLLVIILELNHYLHIIGQPYEFSPEISEEGKIFFKEIFGVPRVTGLDEELENKLTNISNWNNQSIDFFHSIMKKYSQTQNLIQFMKPYDDWAPCVEYPRETEGTDN